MPKTDYKGAQDLLHQIGYPIAVDGSWGPRSKAALSSFQRSFNPYRDPVANEVFAPGTAPLSVDGVPGALSFAALRLSAVNRGQLSLNFHYYEFACGHGSCGYCGGWMEVPRLVLIAAEIGRARLFAPHGMGLEVIGGSRCEQRNRIIIKGASNSQHLHSNLGNALDPPSYFTWEQWRDARAGVTAMEVRAGSGDACFHIDCRPGSTTAPQVFGWVPRLRSQAPQLHAASSRVPLVQSSGVAYGNERCC